jgi:hypothetical protein
VGSTHGTKAPCFNVSVQLIRLIDGNDGLFDIPQMLDGDVVADTSELPLESDSSWVVRGRIDRVPRRPTLRVRVLQDTLSDQLNIERSGSAHVMIITEISCAVIVPTSHRIDDPGRIHTSKLGSEVEFRSRVELSPAFIVDDPGHDRRERSVGVDELPQLRFKLGLL